MNARLTEFGELIPIKADTDNVTHLYESHCLADQGISLIRTYQSPNASNCISFAINPQTLVKQKYQPIKLFHPTERKCERILDKLMDAADHIGLADLNDSRITEDRFSLSQIDVTMNCWFEDGTNLEPYIRLFGKSNIPRHFHRVKNKHGYFCCKNGTVSIKAYDKIRELSERGHLPDKLEDKSILRIEVSMKRGKFLTELDLNKNDSLFEMLDTAYADGQRIIDHYLEKLFPCVSDHYPYSETEKKIQKLVKKDKLKNRMLDMLKKTSDKAGLDKAIQSMKESGLRGNQIDRILEEFDRIDVNPITIRAQPGHDRIPNIHSLIEKCGTVSESDADIENGYTFTVPSLSLGWLRTMVLKMQQ